VPDTHNPDDRPAEAVDSSRGPIGPSTPSAPDVKEHTVERDDPPDPSEVEPTDNSMGAAIDLERLEEIEEFGTEG